MYQQLHSTLRSSAETHPFDAKQELLFTILFGLPANASIQIAQDSTRRFLPVFQNRWPDCHWPSVLLNDVPAWVETHGCGSGDSPESDRLADNAWLYSLDALVNAVHYRTDPFCLTSSCSIAITQATFAFVTFAWETDDPEAVQLWRKGSIRHGRGLRDNAASVETAVREWTNLVNVLSGDAVRSMFSVYAETDILWYVERWRDDKEFCLVGPFEAES